MKPLPHSGPAAFALVLIFACSAPDEGSAPGPPAPADEPAPTTLAEWGERARRAVGEAPRSFELTELEDDTTMRTAILAVYPAEGRPLVDLAWSDGSLLRSDGETVYWREADGRLLVSPWSEAGSILYQRAATRLLSAALDPTSFAAYGGELTEEGDDAVRLRTPLPSGGAWNTVLSKATYLPRWISVQGTAEGPVEKLVLEPAGEAPPRTAADLRIAPAPGSEAERFYAGPAPGDPAPEVTFELAEGGSVSIGGLEGSVVVIDFWATWCAPCRPAMQKLDELAKKHQDDDLAVYGLRVFDSGDASAYLESLGVGYPIGDGTPFVEPYGIDDYGLPVLYVIGRDGTIEALLVGFSEATETALEQAIGRALAAGPEAYSASSL